MSVTMRESSKYITEERVLPCPGACCINLLKIRVYILNEVDPEFPLQEKGSIQLVEGMRSQDNNFTSGACLRYRISWTLSSGKAKYLKPVFEMGPDHVLSVNLVACCHCFVRVGWKRFKKVEL